MPHPIFLYDSNYIDHIHSLASSNIYVVEKGRNTYPQVTESTNANTTIESLRNKQEQTTTNTLLVPALRGFGYQTNENALLRCSIQSSTLKSITQTVGPIGNQQLERDRFHLRLFEILNMITETEVIQWNSDSCWEIMNWNRFAKKMDQYFPYLCSPKVDSKTTRINAFIRELKTWGFRGVSTDKNRFLFKHQYFCQKNPVLLKFMKPMRTRFPAKDLQRLTQVHDLGTTVKRQANQL